MKKLLAALIFFVALQTFAQNLKFDGVLEVRLRNAGEILGEDNQIKGYYYFYKVDKADKGNYNYILKLADENLREINSIEIVRSKNSYLVEAEYNGEAFAFLYYDSKTKMYEINTFDKMLKSIGKIEMPVKGNSSSFESILSGMGDERKFLVGVKNKGFLFYGLSESKRALYQIDYYDNNLKTIWTTTATSDGKETLLAEGAFQTDELIGSYISKNFFYAEILLNDLATGKTLFKKEIKDDKYNLSVSKIVYDAPSKSVMLFGEYYDITDKAYKSNSLGFYTIMLDLQGNLVQKKFISYGQDVSKFIPVSETGKMEAGLNIYVHDILRTADGEIFVVAEQFKKAVSGIGIAATMLSRGNAGVSAAQMVIMNLMVFKFDSNLDLKEVQIFEKDKNVCLLPAGVGFWSPKLLANYIKATNGFDYVYSQFLKDKKSFLITYINYNKEKGEQGKNILGMIVYTPEKVFTIDKMPLNRTSTDYAIRRAKSGYIMVMEYFKKEKNIDVRLEKVNY